VALYYIFPTFRLNSLEKQERIKVEEISVLTKIPQADIYQLIYNPDVDFKIHLEDAGISADTVRKAESVATELREKVSEKLVEVRGKAIRQGLDLRGGMHLVMEVDLVKLMENTARQKDSQFEELIAQIRTEMKETEQDFFEVVSRVFGEHNVPLNRYFGDLRSSEGDVMKLIEKEATDAVDRSLEILRNRIDQFGVAEPSIQQQGNHRIVLELPGVQDPARARALVGKTALLEFKLLAEADRTQKTLADIDHYLKRELGAKASGITDSTGLEGLLAQTEEDTATSDTVQTPPRESQDAVVDIKELLGEEASVSPTDTTVMVDRESMTEHPFYTLLRNVENNIGVPEKNYSIVNRILHRREIQNLLPPDYEFLWSKLAEEAPDGNKYYRLYLLKKEPELIGKYLNDAQVQIGGGGDDASSTGLPIVTLEMNREGARIFSRVTGANVGKFLAIVLDNKVHMAPRIKTKIPDGRAIIEGSKDMEEAKDLAIVLRAGALPAPVEIIEERTVGPSLGSDSVKKGTLSGLGGLIFVILFMIWYYRLGGLIADLALILNVLFIMAVLAGFHGTLTLPGIAGIILTIGMAVDANVLIYERIREELRTGKTIKAAIEAGYSRAVVVIFDSNLTTLMSAIVLYQFGTGPIRGFALTLMIGLSASMFTAIVVTRAIFDWYTAKYNPQVLRI
jgi:preprotein translocase subunit SecD